MSAKAKLSGRLSFRIPAAFDLAVEELSHLTGWDRTDIGRCGLQTFWPDIVALAMSSSPTEDAAKMEENRQLARLLRSARTNGLDIRRALTQALEAQLVDQARQIMDADSAEVLPSKTP